jgi:prolyl-tRNA editing enzyme YbaK/EbsC (Cys-tRNA(Pro) deacylase)
LSCSLLNSVKAVQARTAPAPPGFPAVVSSGLPMADPPHVAATPTPTGDPAWDRVREFLDSLNVPYEAMPCDPAFADTAAFCERYGVAPDQSANTILVASRQEPKIWAACVVLSTTRLDVNHAVRRLVGGKKLSFASAEETRGKTGMMIGGVTPFALPSDIPIYIDARMMGVPWVVVGGGSRSWKVRLAPDGLARMPNTSVVPDLATAVGERPA